MALNSKAEFGTPGKLEKGRRSSNGFQPCVSLDQSLHSIQVSEPCQACPLTPSYQPTPQARMHMVSTFWFGPCLISLYFLPANPTTTENSRQVTCSIHMIWLQPRSYRENLHTALKCSGSLCLMWKQSTPLELYDTPRQALTAYPEQIWTFHHPNSLHCPYLGSELSGHLGPPLQHPAHVDPAILCPEWLISLFHIWLIPHSLRDFLKIFQIYSVNGLSFCPPWEGVHV